MSDLNFRREELREALDGQHYTGPTEAKLGDLKEVIYEGTHAQRKTLLRALIATVNVESPEAIQRRPAAGSHRREADDRRAGRYAWQPHHPRRCRDGALEPVDRHHVVDLVLDEVVHQFERLARQVLGKLG